MRLLNKVEWLAISVVSVVVFAILTNWFEWAVYPMCISLLYPIGFSIVMFYNMIKNL